MNKVFYFLLVGYWRVFLWLRWGEGGERLVSFEEFVRVEELCLFVFVDYIFRVV